MGEDSVHFFLLHIAESTWCSLLHDTFIILADIRDEGNGASYVQAEKGKTG